MLSFKLMGLESIISGKEEIGRSLMQTQDFFDQCSRDIVDESDENFSVKFELIYTMGTQRQLEMGPTRWTLIQQVLLLVDRYAPMVLAELPRSILYKKGANGQFPRIRILRKDAEVALVEHIARHICQYGLDGLPVGRQSAALRHAIFTYVTKFELGNVEVVNVESSSFWTPSISRCLLLLRGLLACGILGFTLGQKRWRVNYGSAGDREPPTKLAVPYRAKDNPSPRSEFSHADVVIVLTCLNYFYGGLDNEDLFAAYRHLAESDRRDVEYATWISDSDNMPPSFHNFDGINLQDRAQCVEQVFPPVRQSKSVVNYFLTHIVFPKEMKEFPSKLSTSGWDIAKIKHHPTTGFSGTKDSGAFLPLNIVHLDLREQKHTNALVLEYLLQSENLVSLMRPATDDNTSDAEQLLSFVLNLDDEIQVILDVGAQIIELDNLQVAETWLRMHHDSNKEGVVFCNDNDDLCVVDREGRVELLQTSSFVSRLDVCLIYLDEAHTRGIDLKLPPHFRAAVTLGDNVTKDKLVQACMRLRKLGQGQTVHFCVSDEIQTKIKGRVSKAARRKAKVKHVLAWSILETLVDARRSIPLWAVQGERFTRQQMLFEEAMLSDSTEMTQAHAEKFLEEEAQSVEWRYRPRLGNDAAMIPSVMTSTNKDIMRIADRCREFDDLNFESTNLREEQERELSPEIQQERQRQNPEPVQPLEHKLHPDVLTFWSQSKILPRSKGYVPAFRALIETSAANDFDLKQLGNNTVLVSQDFAKTVTKSGKGYSSDQYQRHVQWLLTSHVNDHDVIDRILIISPFEANALRHRDDRSPLTTMHLYKAHINLNYTALDKLDFHTIPKHDNQLKVPLPLATQLNLFAGQLYIGSYEDYLEICKCLGVAAELVTEEMTAAGWKVAADGFIMSDNHGRVGGVSGLRQSPLKFIKFLMTTVRKNGEGINGTDIGKLLEGQLFQECDFDRPKN